VIGAISPAAKGILRLAQKGFIPGRQISDHVEDVTRIFYSNVERKQQHFLLLLNNNSHSSSLFSISLGEGDNNIGEINKNTHPNQQKHK
jgi:hypothetical protein